MLVLCHHKRPQWSDMTSTLTASQTREGCASLPGDNLLVLFFRVGEGGRGEVLSGLEYSGAIITYYSLDLLGTSSPPPTLTLQVYATTLG